MIRCTSLLLASLLRLSTISVGLAVSTKSASIPDESSSLTRVWLRYREGDEECYNALKTLSDDTSSSLTMLRRMERTNSVLTQIPLNDLQDIKSKFPCIQSMAIDPKRELIVGPVHTITRRELSLVWQGQAQSYGIELVQADKLHERGLTGAGVTVCVVDTGFDTLHPDFDQSRVSGESLVPFTEWSTDGNGHGTLSAGIIAAQNNDIGLLGVAPEVNIVAVAVFDTDGFITSSADLMDAAEICREQGANIINISAGGFEPLMEEDQYFQDLYYEEGILTVASAGNTGSSEISYPASYSSVVSVGAVTQLSEVAGLSSYNEYVDIAAPGVNVWSTLPDNFDCFICQELISSTYAMYDGTSASAPFVSGIAALLWSFDPTVSVEYVNNALLASALDAGSFDRDVFYGQGILQGDAAYETLIATLNGTQDLQDWTVYDPSFGGPSPERCRPNELTVSVDIVADNYPDEIFWEVTRMVDGFTVLAGDESTTRCLPANCYMVKVIDAAGDGICCEYGRGSFDIQVDRETVLDSTNFTDVAQAAFGDSCIPLDFTTKTPCAQFTMEFTTDSYPSESSVLLEDLDTGASWWGDEVFLESDVTYTLSQCVNPMSCIRFTLFDSFGDGLFFPGTLVLSFDGDEVFSGEPSFLTEFSVLAGACSGNATVV